MKTIVYIGTSLDGFIARKDGDIDWLTIFANKEVFDSYYEFIARIDAFVIGRKTFEKVLDFPTWPYTKNVFVLSTSMKQVPAKARGKVTLLA
jgi:dihydrofolate reductase